MVDVAIIVAAGSGSRMKSSKNKLLLPLGGKTVIERTVKTFEDIPQIGEIIVVCREEELETMSSILPGEKITFVIGGKTRQESVKNAVETIDPDECETVIIHDGARPIVTKEEILETLEEAKRTGAAATGVFVKDTIKVINDDYVITDTPDRTKLVAIHTPQIFNLKLYLKAMEKAAMQKKDFTDDCKLLENIGVPVSVVIGEYGNIKITTPEDIPMAQAILEERGDE